MRTVGFKNADGTTGYYGPYAVGQSPQEQAASSSGAAKKDPLLTSQMKQSILDTVLGLGSSLAQSKLNGTSNISPGSYGAGDIMAPKKSGLGTGAWIAISLGAVALIGGIWYYTTH